MLKVAIGHSEQIDIDDIMAEIIEQCEGQLGGAVPKAGILFSAIDMEYQKILSSIRAKWPSLQLIGCTTDGEVSSSLGFTEDSVLLTLFASDTIEITVGVGRAVSKDSGKAAIDAVTQARETASLKPVFCITTPTGLTANGAQLVENLKKALGEDVALFGATAGDQWRFKETFQFYNDEVLTDALPVILFSGSIHLSSGIKSGWEPIGSPGVITRSEGSVIFEIDNIPALEFYQKLFGEGSAPDGNTPFAILDSNGGISRMRVSIGIYDKDAGSVTFLGDMPQNASVQIMAASREQVVEGARKSARSAVDSYPEGCAPDGGFYFSCAGRKNVLGTRTREEYEALKIAVGREIPIFGFYGYGEIGPEISGGEGCEFHNETFITVLFGHA